MAGAEEAAVEPEEAAVEPEEGPEEAPAAAAEEEAALGAPETAAVNGASVTSSSPYVPPPLPSAADAMASMDAEDIKEILLDSMEGTEKGLEGSAESRGEILELLAQLEARNPTPAPTSAAEMSKLEGTWRLVWTSTSELVALLAASRLPFLRVVDVYQTIDGASRTAENRVVLEVPFARTSVSATASLEVTSPKRLNVTFTKTGVATPTLLDDVDVPSSVEVLGNAVDLSLVRTPLLALRDSFVGAARGLEAALPSELREGLELPLSAGGTQLGGSGWLMTTYLDDDLRISRGDGGGVFVLVRDYTGGYK